MQKAVYEERRIMGVGSLSGLESTLQTPGELKAREIVERNSKVPPGSERDVISYLFSVYYNELFRYAYKLCMDYDATNDLVQDTFVKAYTSLPNFYAGSTYKTWLYKILNNTFISSLRKEKANSTEHFSSLKSNGKQPEAEYSSLCYPSIEEEAFFHEREDAISHALSLLPETFSQPIELFYMDGMFYKEIADRLGIKLGTLKSRVSRGKELLRKNGNGLHELLDL